MKVGQRVSVEFHGLDRAGVALALHEEVELQVLGALPGERALVHVEHLGRHDASRQRRAYGRLVEVLAPAPERVVPPCSMHDAREGKCTGCPWMFAHGSRQAEEKRRMLKDHHALVVDEVIRGRSDVGYRWSSKRVARSRDGRLVLGSFRRGSHRVADMEECLVDHPDIASAARHISGVASYLGIEAWDERTGEGDLRYVCFKTNGRGDVLVTLISGTDRSRMPELAAELEGFAGIAWSVQADTGNAIRGGDARLLRGVPSIEVELAEQRVAVGPLGFLQPNPEVASLAYRELCDVPASELVFDLYAGAGVTTALLSRRAQKVLTCESNPESAAGLGARAETVEVFLARGLEEGLAPRVVVANPPRSGMGPEVCRALKAFARRGLQELRLMSCGPAGLRRDLDDLSPAFELVSLRAYDTLPHTPHVELVAKLHAVPGSE